MLLHALFMTALTGSAASAQTVTHPPTTSSAIARIEMIDETARTVTLHFDRDRLTSNLQPEIVRASLPPQQEGGVVKGGPGRPVPAARGWCG